MKNMKVSLKLIVSFLIVTALTASIGIVGIYGMIQTSGMTRSIYYEQFTPLEQLASIQDYLQRARVNVREMVVGVVSDDQRHVEASYAIIANYVPRIQQGMIDYAQTINAPEYQTRFRNAQNRFNDQLVPVVGRIYAAAQRGDLDTIVSELATCRELSALIEADLDACMDYKDRNAEAIYQDAEARANMLLILIIVLLILVIIISMLLAFYISGIISKPLVILSKLRVQKSNKKC
jgi:methyl-accepting chemotaxis protein